MKATQRFCVAVITPPSPKAGSIVPVRVRSTQNVALHVSCSLPLWTEKSFGATTVCPASEIDFDVTNRQSPSSVHFMGSERAVQVAVKPWARDTVAATPATLKGAGSVTTEFGALLSSGRVKITVNFLSAAWAAKVAE